MSSRQNKSFKITSFFSEDRKFGFLIFFSFLYILKLTKSPYVLFFDLFVFFVTLFYPSKLSPALKFWLKIGPLIGKFTTPLLLGFIFFGLFVPISFFFKLTNRDFLRINKSNRRLKSFWIPKQNFEKDLRTFFKNQF